MVAAVAWEAVQKATLNGEHQQVEAGLEAGEVNGSAVIAIYIRLKDEYLKRLDERLSKTRVGRVLAEATMVQRCLDSMKEVESIARAVAVGMDGDVFIRLYGTTLVVGDPGIAEFLID
jgi:hypothetical protein